MLPFLIDTALPRPLLITSCCLASEPSSVVERFFDILPFESQKRKMPFAIIMNYRLPHLYKDWRLLIFVSGIGQHPDFL